MTFAPKDRMSLYDVVRPPAGWTFDAMVVCTYSADLRSVLALPGALAGSVEGAPLTTSVITPAQLAVLRRTCDRTIIFCQEAALLGADDLPPAVIEVEPLLHEVSAPGGGAFHPKVWMVRFAEGERQAYRLAVMSRNLTADRSWDAGVVMEGKRSSRVRSNGLSELLAALPGRCRRPLDPARAQLLEAFSEVAAHLQWSPPAGLSRPMLHVSGVGKTWAPPPSDRLIVLSPFLDGATLKRLAKAGGESMMLVSRPDALDRTWSAATSFERKAVLSAPVELTEDFPHGALHAKLYAWERGAKRSLALGSMNATSPALDGRNVEFMVEFDASGLWPDGISTLLDDQALGQILVDYAPEQGTGPEAPPPDDRPARRAVCDLDLRLRCEASGEDWRVTLVSDRDLTSEKADLLTGLTFRPATAAGLAASPCLAALLAGREAVFPHMLPLAEVTGFVVFEADDVGAFTLNLVVEGVDAEERRRAALRTLLPDSRSFMNFVRALLGEISTLEQQVAGADGDGGSAAWTFSAAQGGLLEMLVRCAADEPERLRHVDEAIRSFGEDEFKLLAPQNFRDLWQALAKDIAP